MSAHSVSCAQIVQASSYGCIAGTVYLEFGHGGQRGLFAVIPRDQARLFDVTPLAKMIDRVISLLLPYWGKVLVKY